MSDWWTDKKRGYGGDGMPSFARNLSFNMDRLEKLGGLDTLRRFQTGADGEASVSRFGKYERGVSKKPREEATKRSFCYTAIAYFTQTEMKLKLLKCTEEGYETVNECTVAEFPAFDGFIEMANAAVTWDIIGNCYRLFIANVYSIDSTGQEIWVQNNNFYILTISTGGVITSTETIVSLPAYNNCIGRSGVKTVIDYGLGNNPFNYFIPLSDGALKFNSRFSSFAYYNQSGVTIPPGGSSYRRYLDTSVDGKEMVYAGEDLASPTYVQIWRENIITQTITKQWLEPSRPPFVDIINSVIQSKDKLYFDIDYVGATAEASGIFICSADVDDIQNWNKLAEYTEVTETSLDHSGSSYDSRKLRYYIRLINISTIKSLLFVAKTKEDTYIEEYFEDELWGKREYLVKQTTDIDVYAIDGTLLYTIPIFPEADITDEYLGYHYSYTYDGMRYGYIQEVANMPRTVMLPWHKEVRISVTEGMI